MSSKWRPINPDTKYPAPGRMTKAWLERHFGTATSPGYSKVIDSRTECCMIFKRTRMPFMTADGWAFEVVAEMPPGRAVATGYAYHEDSRVALRRWATAMDAALVDDRFIVDAWQPARTGRPAKTEGIEDPRLWTGVPPLSTQVVFDLKSPDDAAELERIHGDMSKWTVLPTWFRKQYGIACPADIEQTRAAA